jgi:hypothetical protein
VISDERGTFLAPTSTLRYGVIPHLMVALMNTPEASIAQRQAVMVSKPDDESPMRNGSATHLVSTKES